MRPISKVKYQRANPLRFWRPTESFLIESGNWRAREDELGAKCFLMVHGNLWPHEADALLKAAKSMPGCEVTSAHLDEVAKGAAHWVNTGLSRLFERLGLPPGSGRA